nr:MAG: hypothetical protein DIU54_09875 [Acidobacteriota bacterium]
MRARFAVADAVFLAFFAAPVVAAAFFAAVVFAAAPDFPVAAAFFTAGVFLAGPAGRPAVVFRPVAFALLVRARDVAFEDALRELCFFRRDVFA